MASFGLTLPQRGALTGATTIDELVTLARQADTCELLDSVWVGDSLLLRPRADSLTLLGMLAGVTTRVRLGVGCMASFPLRDPLVFAYQWASLDVISGGRMQIAVCTGLTPGGASEGEGAVVGVVDRDRTPRLEEHLDICRRLWAGDTVDVEGRFNTYRGARLEVRPVQEPCPAWIASNPRTDRGFIHAAERAVRLADGVMTSEAASGTVERLAGAVDAVLEAKGRDRNGFTVAAYHNVVVGETREAAHEESLRFLSAYTGASMTPERARTWTAAGRPEDCAADLQALIDIGVDVITLRLTSYDQAEQYDRLVGEVLPLLA